MENKKFNGSLEEFESQFTRLFLDLNKHHNESMGKLAILELDFWWKEMKKHGAERGR